MFTRIFLLKLLNFLNVYFIQKLDHEKLKELCSYLVKDVLKKVVIAIRDDEPNKPQLDAIYQNIILHYHSEDKKLLVVILRNIIKDDALFDQVLELIEQNK